MGRKGRSPSPSGPAFEALYFAESCNMFAIGPELVVLQFRQGTQKQVNDNLYSSFLVDIICFRLRVTQGTVDGSGY